MSAALLREVRLYGSLGDEFGRVHRLAVNSAAEAVRALCSLFPSFEARVLSVAPGYRVTVGRRRLDEAEQLHDPSGRRDVIRIVPVLAGGKSKWVGIIVGVALVAAAFVTGGATLGAAGIAFSGLGGQLAFTIGASLVIGGLSQMLAPQPKMQAGSDAENKPSYVFNGAQNTAAQGLPVPVGYGRLIVGSSVISSAVVVEEYETAAPVPVGVADDPSPPTFGRGIGFGRDGGTGNRFTIGDTLPSNPIIDDIPSTRDIYPGMPVVAPYVPNDVFVSKILDDTRVELSTGVGVTTGLAQPLLFEDPGYEVTTTGNTVANSSTIQNIPTTRDIYEGMIVEGPTLPLDATVTSVVTNASLTLSSGVGVTSGVDVPMTLTFPEVTIPIASTTTVEGSTVVTMASTTGILAGMVVEHPAIPDGALVKTIVNATTVVIDEQATASLAGVAAAFVDPTYSVEVVGRTTSGSAVVVIDSPVDVVAGMTVAAATVPVSATVASVSAVSTVTIDTAVGVTAGTGVALTFVDPVVAAPVSEGGSGFGPYASDPGYSWPEAPGDTTGNSGSVIDFYDRGSFNLSDS